MMPFSFYANWGTIGWSNNWRIGAGKLLLAIASMVVSSMVSYGNMSPTAWTWVINRASWQESSAGRRQVTVELVFFNSWNREVIEALPASIPAAVVDEAGRRAASLDLVPAVGLSPVLALAPAEFRNVSYVSSLEGWPTANRPDTLWIEVDGRRVVLRPSQIAPQPEPALAVAGATEAGAGPPVDNGPGREPLNQAAIQRNQFAEFARNHFFPHDPIFFLWGPSSPNVKFQFSMKYRLVNPEGLLPAQQNWLNGLYMAYTQTSLWDWIAESKPFLDSSYKPEFHYADDQVGLFKSDWLTQKGWQFGVQHESNGKAGSDSRSLNLVYFKPTLVLGDPARFHVTLQPKFYFYIDDLADNPTLDQYRFFCDLRIVLGQIKGWELSALGRMGKDWNKGSVQFDLTYPLKEILWGNLDSYLHLQYFTGFGESLLHFDEEDSIFRAGISLVR